MPTTPMTEKTETPLAERRCTPCRGGTPPLSGAELAGLQNQLPGWETIEGRQITKTFRFADFVEALDFVNRIGDLAERQRHHPDIYLSWGKVRVELSTHRIGGLSESDFILAAMIDRL